MFENFDDILTVEEACEALKIGYNAMYELLNTGIKAKGKHCSKCLPFAHDEGIVLQKNVSCDLAFSLYA